jgi:hypothetical protein
VSKRPAADSIRYWLYEAGLDEIDVAKLLSSVVAEEREACAKLVEKWTVDRESFVLLGPRVWSVEPGKIAAAIRSRKP